MNSFSPECPFWPSGRHQCSTEGLSWSHGSSPVSFNAPIRPREGQVHFFQGASETRAGSPSSTTVAYTYDQLNRLATALSTTGGTTNWGLSFSYDVYGNRTGQTVTVGSAPAFSAAFDSNNRMVGYSYDNNGNQLTTPDGATLEYDADNRLKKWTKQGQSEEYQYHPSGWRLQKAGPSWATYLYGPGGQLLTANGTGPSAGYTDYVYFTGRLLYTLSNGEHGYTAVTRMYSDRLGSTRATQTQEYIWNSTTTRNYYPYGEEIGTTANDQYKYASTYRDSATGLDYAVNRYYASGTARFTIPDPLGHGAAKLTSSISWNLYVYSRNDPVNSVDPSGLDNEVVNTVFAQGTVNMCYEEGGTVYYGLQITTGSTTDSAGNTVFTRSVVALAKQQWGAGQATLQPSDQDTVSEYTQYGTEIAVTAEVGQRTTQNYAPDRQFLFRGAGWTQLGAAGAKPYVPVSLSTSSPYSFSYSAGTWTTTNGGTGQFAYGVGALFQNGQVTINEGYFETNGSTATLLGVSTTFDSTGMLTMSRREVFMRPEGTTISEAQYFRCGTGP